MPNWILKGNLETAINDLSIKKDSSLPSESVLHDALSLLLRKGLFDILDEQKLTGKINSEDIREIAKAYNFTLKLKLLLQDEENIKLIERLKQQLQYLLWSWLDTNYSPGLSRWKLKHNDAQYLSDLINSIMGARLVRGEKLWSKHLLRAIEIQKNIFNGNKIIFFRCIDGRVWKSLICWITPNAWHMGIARAAWDPEEFTYSENWDLELLLNSDTAKALNETIKLGKTFTVYLDSHCWCAAWNIRQKHDWVSFKDSWLYHDIKRKIKIAEAIRKYVSEKNWKVTVIHWSFDPHSWEIFTWLNRYDVLKEGKEGWYTKIVLDKLVANNKILWSKKFAKIYENIFYDAYNKYIDWEAVYFDWGLNMSDTWWGFWNSVNSFYNDLIIEFNKEVSKIFPDLLSSEQWKQEINQMATILLLNSFNYFCQNKDQTKKYPYSQHTEHAVIVSKQEFWPYVIMNFTEWGGDSVDLNELWKKILFACNIVRWNRSDGRIDCKIDNKNTWENNSNEKEKIDAYSNKNEFTDSPVPVIIWEIIGSWKLDIDWEEVDWINYDFLIKNNNWFFINESQINIHLYEEQGINDIRVINAIKILISKMQAICKPSTEIASQIATWRVLLIPTLMDEGRIVRRIIPMNYRWLPTN